MTGKTTITLTLAVVGFMLAVTASGCRMLRPIPPQNAPSQLVNDSLAQTRLDLRRAFHQLGWTYEETGGTDYFAWQLKKGELLGRAAVEKREKQTLITVGVGRQSSVFSTVEGESWELSRDLLDKLLKWLAAYRKERQKN